MATCKHPDRDVPKLVCGYPMPCPHHTVVLEEDELADVDKLQRALANLRWLSGRVSVSTYTLIAPCSIAKGDARPLGGSVVRVVTKCTWSRGRQGVGSPRALRTKDFLVELPLHATTTEIRNAIEEQQIEARAWLEEHYATPQVPVRVEEVEASADAALAAAAKDGIAAWGTAPAMPCGAHMGGNTYCARLRPCPIHTLRRALGYLPGCRRPQHLDGQACEGGCDEVPDPKEFREAADAHIDQIVEASRKKRQVRTAPGRTVNLPRTRGPRKRKR